MSALAKNILSYAVLLIGPVVGYGLAVGHAPFADELARGVSYVAGFTSFLLWSSARATHDFMRSQFVRDLLFETGCLAVFLMPIAFVNGMLHRLQPVEEAIFVVSTIVLAFKFMVLRGEQAQREERDDALASSSSVTIPEVLS